MRGLWPFFIAAALVMLQAVACIDAPIGPLKSFDAEKSVVTKSKPAKLTAVFDGTGTVDHEIGTIASGVPFETPLLVDSTTYTLTVVSDLTGETAQRSVEIRAVDPAVITSFKAEKVVRPGEATNMIAVFTGGAGTVDLGIGPVTSGTPVPTGVLAATKEYTLTVTNEAGDAATAKAEAEAAVTPVITSFTAPGAVVSRFEPTTLTAVYTGGHGKVDQGVGEIKSNEPTKSQKVPPAGATFTLTVTNGLGEAVSKTIAVTTKTEVFVTDYGGDVLVYDADSMGDVPPKRTILTAEGKNTGSNIAGILSVIVTDTEIFIANEQGRPGITVFDIAAFDDEKPKRRIVGGATTIDGANMIDVAGGEIFVADKTSTIKIWNVGDDGDVPPRRTLSGPNTGLDNCLGTWIDDGELYVSNYANAGAGSITVYPQSASGNVMPTRTIPTATPTGITISGSELFVASKVGEVTVYDKKTGAQLRKLAGAATQLTELYQCSVNGSELFCASYINDRMVVFPANASGNVAPTRVVQGDKTYIASPACAFVF